MNEGDDDDASSFRLDNKNQEHAAAAAAGGRSGDGCEEERQEARENHKRFMASLERHAGQQNNSTTNLSRATLSSMATDLGWDVHVVETYAYRVLMAMLNSNNSDTDDQTNDGTQQQDSSDVNGDKNSHEDERTNGNASSEWTYEEDILLDSLLAVYLPSAVPATNNSNNNNSAFLDWEEQVASNLPGRTPFQVRQRYRQRYGDRGR